MSYENPQYLVEPEQLDLADPRLRLFDVSVIVTVLENGYRADSALSKYAKRHIPGANYLNVPDDLSDTTTGLMWSLPSIEDLQAAFRKAGVNDDSKVVFYSTGNMAAGHMMLATRAFWLLFYLGHRDVAVLNGGLNRWRAEDRALATNSPIYPEGTFTARPDSSRFVTAQDVIDATGSETICTLNALSPELYEGAGERHYGRPGHIPGSINLYYDDLLENGSFKSAESLRKSLSDRGILDAERTIIYCGGGVSATIDGLACLLSGYTNVGIYDGSMGEWIRDGRPLKVGAEP